MNQHATHVEIRPTPRSLRRSTRFRCNRRNAAVRDGIGVLQPLARMQSICLPRSHVMNQPPGLNDGIHAFDIGDVYERIAIEDY